MCQKFEFLKLNISLGKIGFPEEEKLPLGISLIVDWFSQLIFGFIVHELKTRPSCLSSETIYMTKDLLPDRLLLRCCWSL